MKTIFTREDCTNDEYYEGKLVIKRFDSLKPEYQDAYYQLVLACGGFGCDPTKMGRAVSVYDCCDGESYRVNREDILGVASDNAIAEWKEKFGEFHESVQKRLGKQA